MGSPEETGAHALREIEAGNDWYTSSQFAWARQPCVCRIYERRRQFFRACIERAKHRRAGVLRLLDAGCGDGYWLHEFAGIRELETTGVDYNPLRVERARKAAPAARVVLGDLASLKPEETFDVILCSQVIEHVADDVALLRLLRGLLAPGGTLILGTTNEGSALHRRRMRKMGSPSQTDHVHFYTEAEVTRKLRETGFGVDCVMREVFALGNERLYYWLNARAWGFALLEGLTALWPAECSDFYFECRIP